MKRLPAETLLGAALLALLALPAVRHGMESSMWRHMLLQAPAWLLAGALLAVALPARVRAGLVRWNRHGVSGLLGAALVFTLLMVPRVLDLALLRADVEVAKLLALLLAGAALRLSWRPAGLVLQFFFLGNVLAMMVVVGQLYIDSPLRLCNAYLLDDQERLGRWLIGVAALVAVAWLAHAFWSLVRSDEATLRQAALAPAPPPASHRP